MQVLHVSELKELMRPAGDELQVVFVSACHSRAAGEAFLAAGVPHVVCCNQEVKVQDMAAYEFARNFYRASACGRSLAFAFELARQAVRVSPLVVGVRLVEMDKFLLLPEKPNGDLYGDFLTY